MYGMPTSDPLDTRHLGDALAYAHAAAWERIGGEGAEMERADWRRRAREWVASNEGGG